MATIIVESKWPNASNEKLAKAWLEMGDVPESQTDVEDRLVEQLDEPVESAAEPLLSIVQPRTNASSASTSGTRMCQVCRQNEQGLD